MKIPSFSSSSRRQGFALLLVMVLVGVSLIILTGAVNRSATISKLNLRNNEFTECNNAAEAAVEKAYAILAWQFQGYGVAAASNSLPMMRTNTPLVTESSYWTNFVFSDATGNNGRTYVNYSGSNYTGYLPSAYNGLFAAASPVYRIVSNVRKAGSTTGVTGTAQIDVLLALVPLTSYAIFYNGTLEFTTCADMTVRGRVHANGNICVGTGASLRFYNGVHASGTLSAPFLMGVTSGWTPGTPSTWRTTFDPSEKYVTNVPSVTVSLNMTNSHFLIDVPPAGESAMSNLGQQRLYNKAQMVLIVTNSISGTNPTVILTLQAPSAGNVPGYDAAKTVLTYTNASAASLATNLPFLSLTNSFYDQRERKTNIITDINVGVLGSWTTTNADVQGKLNAASGDYPTILYVADRRSATVTQPGQLPVVRLSNGARLPSNNNMGFTVATQNPLYVHGHYNIQKTSGGPQSVNSSNTVNTLPAALLSDAITFLSGHWSDSYSKNSSQAYSDSGANFDATETTVNAAILTGTMPSTGTSATTFSGGVHNLPRMLEDWSGRNLWINTSMIRLWSSLMATNQFRVPGNYYRPPDRKWAFDLNFLDPAKVPQGIPTALVPIRFGWGSPPPSVTTYTPLHN